MSTQTLITSRDPKGLHAVGLFEAAYNKAGLDDARAQRLNERGGRLQAGVTKLIVELTTLDQYADEEVRSSYTYPREYQGPKPIAEQIEAIGKILGLDPSYAFMFAQNLPALESFVSENALPWVGWFAVISDSGLVKLFPRIEDPALRRCHGIQLIHQKIAVARPFRNFREGQITPAHLRRHAITAEALERLAVTQAGDLWIIAAQLGMLHRGRSTRRACEVFTGNESGLDSLAGCSIALTHPERFVRWEELDMDLPGDEFASGADGGFSRAPCLGYDCDELRFGTGWVGLALTTSVPRPRSPRSRGWRFGFLVLLWF